MKFSNEKERLEALNEEERLEALNEEERLEAFKYFEAEKNRLEALISHLEGSGGTNFDLAPPHVLFEKNIPKHLKKKTATDFLQEYRGLLQQVDAALKELEK